MLAVEINPFFHPQALDQSQGFDVAPNPAAVIEAQNFKLILLPPRRDSKREPAIRYNIQQRRLLRDMKRMEQR